MIAYVTSIGETTTELCIWALERQGFKVKLINDPTSLWDKLRRIFADAEGDFLRVDADVIVNRNVRQIVKQRELWWYQGLTYDWHKQDITHGGVQFVRKQAIPFVNEHIQEARRQERPESYLYRLSAFHNPRMCGTYEKVCGLNGYKQSDVQRVKDTKSRRGQMDDYDFELSEKVSAL